MIKQHAARSQITIPINSINPVNPQSIGKIHLKKNAKKNEFVDLFRKRRMVYLFSKYAFLKNCDRWGDKAAFRTPPLMGAYKRLCPKMKIIHIVRDGRDVALSWRKIWTGPSRVSVKARSWMRQVSYFRGWGKNQNKNIYLEIRYEDLLNDIECVLQRIGKFMNTDPLATGTHLIGSEFAQALSNGNTHPMLAGRINKGNQLKWIRKMNEKDLVTFESIAKKELIKSGYVCNRHFENPNSFLISLKMFADFIIDMISPVNILYKAKYILPALLIISNRCKQIIKISRSM
jgi:hypothetical protein